jgi:hypothetical protein
MKTLQREFESMEQHVQTTCRRKGLVIPGKASDLYTKTDNDTIQVTLVMKTLCDCLYSLGKTRGWVQNESLFAETSVAYTGTIFDVNTKSGKLRPKSNIQRMSRNSNTYHLSLELNGKPASGEPVSQYAIWYTKGSEEMLINTELYKIHKSGAAMDGSLAFPSVDKNTQPGRLNDHLSVLDIVAKSQVSKLKPPPPGGVSAALFPSEPSQLDPNAVDKNSNKSIAEDGDSPTGVGDLPTEDDSNLKPQALF